jgi:Caspase recruitment domain
VKSRDVTYFNCLFLGRYASDDELYKRWPLDSQYESRLTRNFRQLTELIEADVFSTELYSAACINSLQKCDVDETSDKCDKVRKILDFLLQSSIANYEAFVECLKKTNQGHVAKICENDVGELIVQVNR